MGISEDAYLTLQHIGIEGQNGEYIRCTQATQTGVYQLGDPYCAFDMIPLIKLPTKHSPEVLGVVDEYYRNVYDYNIFTPKFKYADVAHINITKAADTDTGFVQFYDESNNLLYQHYLSSNFNCGQVLNPLPPPTYGKFCDVWLCAVVFIENGERHACFCLSNGISDPMASSYPTLQAYNYQVSPVADGYSDAWFEGVLNGVYWDPTGNAAPSGSAGGGQGDFWYNNDNVNVPELPTASVCDTGFVSLYAMSNAQLTSLATDLWDNNFFNSIVKNFASPFDNIISLGIIPITVSGTLSPVVIGNYSAPTSGDKLSTTFIELDFGSLSIIPYYDNFADYEIKTQLFLPYCGLLDLAPSDIVNKTLNIKYHIDIFSGACVAFVTAYDNIYSQVLYTKEGNCRVEIPFSGRDYAQYYNGIQSAAIQMGIGATGMAAGNPMSIATLAGGMVSGINSKPATQRGGSVSGTAAYMNIQQPYLIYTIPNYFIADNMKELKGYVSNLKCTIGDESGFISATIDNADLTGFETATDEELEMIKTALADGIYIS